MEQNTVVETSSTAITHWMKHPHSLLLTNKGYRVRHCAGREVHDADTGRSYYVVDDKGNLTEDGISDPLLGRLDEDLLAITEQLRQIWLADQQQGDAGANAWEARQEARRDRYLARADNARAEGAAAYSQANSMLSVIPLGQPILVGHHSERRHRRTLEKADNLYRKAFVECDGKAEHYENKAAAVGRGGISSDDPDAVRKLLEKLQGCIKSQLIMKVVNAAIRKHNSREAQIAALVLLGYSEENAAVVIGPDFCGRIGFAPYQLQNNNAEIKRLKARIAELGKVKEKTTDSREEHDSFTFEIDSAENRILFVFAGKPEQQIRTRLKSYAFKWSPTRDAWVRKITPNALYAAKCLKTELLALEQ